MEIPDRTITNFEELWEAPATVTADDARIGITEIASKDWRIFVSQYEPATQRHAERFMKSHSYTVGVLNRELRLSFPLWIGEFRDERRDAAHKAAAFTNGLVWQARSLTSGKPNYTVLIIKPETAERWSYPSTYVDIKSVAHRFVSTIKEDQP